jgi:hypothetical protein
MRRPATREALLAARHGRQWRIPRPDNVDFWEMETRVRLKAVGICLKQSLEKELERLADENKSYWPEVYRLYLAASAKALRRGRITLKAKKAIDALSHAALDILSTRKQRFGVDTLKRAFPRHLWRYWPTEEHFKAIQDANTGKAIEAERRRLDFVQAVRILRRRNRTPTAENLCPLLHLDWLAHMNDTGEKLPPSVIDRRQPQLGISLDQFRRRYPVRKQPWRSILAKIYGVLGSIPGAEEMLYTRKKLSRGL